MEFAVTFLLAEDQGLPYAVSVAPIETGWLEGYTAGLENQFNLMRSNVCEKHKT